MQKFRAGDPPYHRVTRARGRRLFCSVRFWMLAKKKSDKKIVVSCLPFLTFLLQITFSFCLLPFAFPDCFFLSFFLFFSSLPRSLVRRAPLLPPPGSVLNTLLSRLILPPLSHLLPSIVLLSLLTLLFSSFHPPSPLSRQKAFLRWSVRLLSLSPALLSIPPTWSLFIVWEPLPSIASRLSYPPSTALINW
ncbi:uncharacterized protein BO72DRAFT_226522 [Aspergillus fijiensis CBS 313.89]|uniref:Transmembrane protein n=1 Tax=Aspergillus fijiensis CBS 313.89 TaxID=1448319 RepID=A0A8G1VV78_9EURO|nr:uncharacterized protein BO72DRAFT_226522 [Aspergillus fijiensis CBS 313.89]RAK73847.1 hypothetical protein BO72DRAFT_226522 [Aspergillus fijiensis CBS 313.89]